VEKGRPRRSPVRALRASAASPRPNNRSLQASARVHSLAVSPLCDDRTIGLQPPPPSYARCRGLRPATSNHQVFHRFSSLPAVRNRAPKPKVAFWHFDRCLNLDFLFPKIISYTVYMCRPMSFYWIRTCCQDLTEFGLAMVIQVS